MQHAQRPEIKTLANLESAFAGESMAHIKYRYFAKIAREMGDEFELTARTFEETANQEVMHAFGHLDLLYPKATMTPAKALQMAIDGETYEYTEMKRMSTPRCTQAFAKQQNKKAMQPRWLKSMNKSKSPKCTLRSSERRLKKPKSDLRPWPKSKSATPNITNRYWIPCWPTKF
ncbi:MAG: hypothetical protein RLZZ454_1556 [Pseudomonadota bacterium]